MNLCINCEYHKVGVAEGPEYFRCTHPDSIFSQEINPVDGSPVTLYRTDDLDFAPQPFPIFAQFMRKEHSYCGPEGKLYKEISHV